MTAYYTSAQFESFCENVFGSFKNAGVENVQVVCPFCKKIKGRHYNKQKLAIHLSTHQVHCWVCGYKAKNLSNLLRKSFPEQLQQYLDSFQEHLFDDASIFEAIEEKISLPDDFILLASPPEDLTKEQSTKIYYAKRYLKDRGITDEKVLWYWKFGISLERKYRNRIITPSFDENGILNYFTARAVIKLPEKYENPRVIRENIIINELNIDWNQELTIVEGFFDMFKCNKNTVAILGSELSGDYKLFEKIVINKTPIVLALDPDAKEKAMQIAKRFDEFDIRVKFLDIRNTGFKDIGEMSREKFKEIYPHATIFNREYFLREKIGEILNERKR